jgi:chromosome segregation ATPase
VDPRQEYRALLIEMFGDDLTEIELSRITDMLLEARDVGRNGLNAEYDRNMKAQQQEIERLGKLANERGMELAKQYKAREDAEQLAESRGKVIESSRAKIDTLEKNIDKINEMLADRDKKIIQLQGANEQLGRLADKKSQEIGDLRDTLSLTNDRLRDAGSNVNELEAQLELVRATVRDRNETIEKMHAAAQHDVDELAGKLEQADAEVRRLGEQVTLLTVAISNAMQMETITERRVIEHLDTAMEAFDNGDDKAARKADKYSYAAAVIHTTRKHINDYLARALEGARG